MCFSQCTVGGDWVFKINTRNLTWPISKSKLSWLVLQVCYKVDIGLKICGLAIRSFCDIIKLNRTNEFWENYKGHDVFLIIDNFLKKYWARYINQHAGGCFIIWMITPEPSFVMTLTGSQKTPVFVIERGTFLRNVYLKCWD